MAKSKQVETKWNMLITIYTFQSLSVVGNHAMQCYAIELSRVSISGGVS